MKFYNYQSISNISLFLICPLDKLFISYFFSIIKSLSNLDWSIISILLDSINFYCLSIFLVHLCNMEFSLSIDILEITRLWIKLSSFQYVIFLFFIISLYFFVLLVRLCLWFWFILRLSCFIFSRNFLFSFHVSFILFNLLLSLLFSLKLAKVLHLFMEILK